MWYEIMDGDSDAVKNTNIIEELYKVLTWKETYRLYVVLNWFRVHDKHRFLQYRELQFYAGDIRGVYDTILARYKKEMKMRGKRV